MQKTSRRGFLRSAGNLGAAAALLSDADKRTNYADNARRVFHIT